MTIKETIKRRTKLMYKIQPYKGRSLFDWAVTWFKMSNDAFYDLYGFNFNPHDYPMLYELAREEVYDGQA